MVFPIMSGSLSTINMHVLTHTSLTQTRTSPRRKARKAFIELIGKGKLAQYLEIMKSRNKSRRWVKTDPCIGPQGQFTRVTLGVSGDWGRSLSSKGEARSAAGILALFCSLPPLPPSSSSMLAMS